MLNYVDASPALSLDGLNEFREKLRDIGLHNVPFVMLARGMLLFFLKEFHERFSGESGASIKYLKARCDRGIELRNIFCASCSKRCAHCVNHLFLVGAEVVLSCLSGQEIRQKGESDTNRGKQGKDSQPHAGNLL